jgi:hypothetical protein
MQPCVVFIDKSPEILGNALAPKIECANNYGGRIRALPDLCTWGNRVHTRAACPYKQSPCCLDRNSIRCTTPQYECLCGGRANIMNRRRREEVLGRPMWGKRTKSRMYTYHRYAHNPRARCFRPQYSNDHNLLKYGQNVFTQVLLDAYFQCGLNTSTLKFKDA